MKALCCGRWSCHEPRCLSTCLFFLDQVDVSADYVLVRDFRGAMSCLSQTLSITSFFLLLSSFHGVFFLSFLKGSHGYPYFVFDRSPLLASNSIGETFHRPRQTSISSSPFCFLAHHYDWVSMFTICDFWTTLPKRKLDLGDFMTDRAAFIFNISWYHHSFYGATATGTANLRIHFCFTFLCTFLNSLSAWTILILDSHHSLVAW